MRLTFVGHIRFGATKKRLGDESREARPAGITKFKERLREKRQGRGWRGERLWMARDIRAAAAVVVRL